MRDKSTSSAICSGVNPGATSGAIEGMANHSAIVAAPSSTHRKLATTLNASDARSRSPRARYAPKIGMNTIDSAPPASR